MPTVSAVRVPEPGRTRRAVVFVAALLACSVIAFGAVAAPASADGPAGMEGSGTVDDPYEIANATQLQAIEEELAAHYVLVENIDANATSEWNGGDGFDPIGGDSSGFTGSLNGKGTEISGLTIDRAGTDDVGLFESVDGGTVTNVTLSDVDVTGGHRVGALTGTGGAAGTVADVSIDGSVSGAGNVGLLAGQTRDDLSGIHAVGTVNGSGSNVGGVVGQLTSGSLTDSVADVAVTGSSGQVGGAIGTWNGGEVSNVHATGTVTATGDVATNVGGSIGRASSGVSDRELDGATATGAVNAPDADHVGGLVGYSEAPIRNGSATGDVSGADDVGGLVGVAGNAVSNSTASGAVTGTSSVGGLVGSASIGGQLDGSVAASSASGDVTGTSSVGGLVGSNFGPVDESSANGSVTGAEAVGGLVGSSTGSIVDSSASGSVEGSGQFVGGLAGVSSGAVDASRASGDVDAPGANSVGGLVGASQGAVIESTATGTVTGGGLVGGLLGQNVGAVTDSAATGSVSGDADVGGLVGQNLGGQVDGPGGTFDADGELSAVLATGAVDGGDAATTGGLIGNDSEGDVSSAYWNVDGSADLDADDGVGVGSDDGVTGLDSDELTGLDVIGAMDGFDFESTWIPSVEYPDLAGESAYDSIDELLDDRFDDLLDGNGTETVPFEIANVHELQAVAQNPTAHYTLADDVDASETASWNDGAGFEPIGNASEPFDGMFDGQNYTITGLSIDRPGENTVGLFGQAGTDGTVSNVVLTDVHVESQGADDEGVGGLVGVNEGTITRAHVVGDVTGDDFVGGIVGTNKGTLSLASADVAVNGTYAVGGIAGENDGDAAADGVVTEVYAVGSVSATDNFVGGIVGRDTGVISETYAAVEVSGASSIGGVVGSPGSVSDSYCDQSVTAGVECGSGATGLGTDEMTGVDSIERLEALDFETTWVATDGYPRLAWTVESVDLELVESSIAYGEETQVTVDVEFVGGTNETANELAESTDDSVAVVDHGDVVGVNTAATVESTIITVGVGSASDATSLDVEPGASGMISGIVTDETGDPVANATVSAWRVETTTGSDGSFELELPPGVETVTIVAENYRSGETTVAVSEDETATADATLEYRGSGEVDDPYRIQDVDELQAIADELDAHYVLEHQIDAAETATWNGDDGFDPIGEYGDPFTGSFDGNGHEIEGLTIVRPIENEVGLFGVSQGTIRNVSVTDLTVRGNGGGVGGLVGYNDGGTVERASVTGTVTAGEGSWGAGGLVGYNYDGATVSESVATVSVDGDESVGGLVGDNAQSTITASTAAGNVTGSDFVGGLAGGNYQGIVEEVFAVGDVESEGTSGGLVGDNWEPTVEYAYWDVNATGQNESAGDGIGLSTDQMTGANAVEYMEEFAFESDWMATNEYPALVSHAVGLDVVLGSADVEDDETTDATALLRFLDGSTVDVTEDAQFGSSNDGVATVIEGIVTPHAGGSVTINASRLGFEGEAVLTVDTPAPPSSPGPDDSPRQDHGPDVDIVDVDLSDATLQVGEVASATVTLVNDGDAETEYEVALSLDGTEVASETVAVPAGQTTTAELTHTFEESGSYTLSVTDYVFDVTIESDGSGPSEDGGAGDTTADGGASDDDATDDGASGDASDDGMQEDGGSSDDGSPGFGATGAIVVLLLSVAFAYRRR